MNKDCTFCHKNKKIEDFNFKNKNKNQRQSRCKDCTRSEIRNHYRKNKKKYLDKALNRANKIRSINRVHLIEYLNNHPCVDCGNKDIRVLEFDHINNKKERDVGSMIRGFVWESVLKEIKKCQVRCANCHRIKTYIQFDRKSKTMPLSVNG